MENYYGFVYIWLDTVTGKYIIGSHHGRVDDGYTTSTGGGIVKDIFRNRLDTMRRKVIEYNTKEDNYKYTQQLEQKWLSKRPGILYNDRYYNTNNIAGGGFSADIQISQLEAGTHYFQSKEHSKRMAAINIDKAKKGEHISQIMVRNGTHHFLGGSIQRESNRKRVEAGTHNFQDSEAARIQSNKRIKGGTHHFLNSEFNKIAFKLESSDGRVWWYESKVDAVNDGFKPGVIDKVKKYGSFTFIRGSKGKQRIKPGETLTYNMGNSRYQA